MMRRTLQSFKPELFSTDSCIYHQSPWINPGSSDDSDPFFLRGPQKQTFAAGFWVLCARVICTPPRLLQLVLGCGGITKSYPDSQQSSVYKPLGRQGTPGNNADVLLRRGSVASWTSSEIALNVKPKSSDHLNELLKLCSSQLFIFILYSPAELKSERITNTNVLSWREERKKWGISPDDVNGPKNAPHLWYVFCWCRNTQQSSFQSLLVQSKRNR